MSSEEKQKFKWMSMLNINKRLYINIGYIANSTRSSALNDGLHWNLRGNKRKNNCVCADEFMYLVLVNLISKVFSFDTPPFENSEARRDEAGVLLALTISLPCHFSVLFEESRTRQIGRGVTQ